jgi:hypothetical protein
MNAIRALLLAPILFSAPAIYSQDAPAVEPAPPPPAAGAPAATGPAPSTTDLTPATDVPVTPSPAPKLDLMPAQDVPAVPPASEQTLIPEMVDPVEKPAGTAIPQPGAAPTFPKSKTEIAADQLELMVRFRTVKNRVIKEPAIQAEWDNAENARTDYEKREALKRYYLLLYSRMEKLDRTLKAQIADRRVESLRKLTQTRLEPTERPARLGPAPAPEEVRVAKQEKRSTKKKKKQNAEAEVRATE